MNQLYLSQEASKKLQEQVLLAGYDSVEYQWMLEIFRNCRRPEKPEQLFTLVEHFRSCGSCQQKLRQKRDQSMEWRIGQCSLESPEMKEILGQVQKIRTEQGIKPGMEEFLEFPGNGDGLGVFIAALVRTREGYFQWRQLPHNAELRKEVLGRLRERGGQV